MINPPWSRLAKRRPDANGRQRPRQRPIRFIPCLESLEDRSLPSVIASIVFSDGTPVHPATFQPVDNPSSYQQVNAANSQAIINVTIGYMGSAIEFFYFSSGSSFNLQVSNVSNNPTNYRNGSFDTLVPSTGNQSQAVLSQAFNFDSNGTSFQTELALSVTSYSVNVDTLKSPGATTFTFDLAEQDAAGNKTNSNPIMIQFDGSAQTFLASGTSKSTQIENTASELSLTVTNASGLSNILITITNLGSHSAQSSPLSQSQGESDVIFRYADFVKIMADAGDGNGSVISGVFGHFLLSANPGGQPRQDRNPVIGASSLVVADTPPGFYLTLSISQDISQRAASPSAQATWTGLRPPLEAPPAKPESSNSKWGWASFNEEKNSNSNVAHGGRVPSETDFGPMEIMVANIFRSLKEAKAEDQPKDIARFADRESEEAEFEPNSEGWISNPSLAWEQPGEPDPQGDVNVSLNQLLRGMALKQTIALAYPDKNAGPEENKDAVIRQRASPRKKESSWGWRVLAECMATALMALCWPGVIWNGTNNSQRRTTDYLDK